MKRLTTNLLMLLLGMLSMQLYAVELNSIYPMKPNDSGSILFHSRELSDKGGWKDGCIGCFAGSH